MVRKTPRRTRRTAIDSMSMHQIREKLPAICVVAGERCNRRNAQHKIRQLLDDRRQSNA